MLAAIAEAACGQIGGVEVHLYHIACNRLQSSESSTSYLSVCAHLYFPRAWDRIPTKGAHGPELMPWLAMHKSIWILRQAGESLMFTASSVPPSPPLLVKSSMLST